MDSIHQLFSQVNYAKLIIEQGEWRLHEKNIEIHVTKYILL